ncbi:MAG TPA: tRNA (guanosine(37)-N1)-methyltransferase TrmD [Streptosporangiaceae bacterium]|nr:tRNA (guanosine(37)-N1)-methyltransferase TrmD [Streptosporangiaceae bacterium]
MRIDIITIFPGYFESLRMSLIGKAAARGDIRVNVHDLRNWSHDAHHSVDDTPYGGGPGMVMKAEPWGEALDAAAPAGAAAVPRLVVPTPSGALFTQEVAARYAREPHLLFACGRYEGMDARVLDEARTRMPVEEVSIGDYVLAGGEAAVLVMVEATCRLLPGVLGNAESAADDSFGGVGAATTVGRPGGTGAPAPLGGMAGLLEGPVYTKPRVWRGRDVPAVLLSGNHAAIARWRRDAALRRTARMRPELAGRLDPATLDARDREVLSEAGFPVHSEDVAH